MTTETVTVRAGDVVAYRGSLAERRGAAVYIGVCTDLRCMDALAEADEAGKACEPRFELFDRDGRPLRHVRRSSFVAAPADEEPPELLLWLGAKIRVVREKILFTYPGTPIDVWDTIEIGRPH